MITSREIAEVHGIVEQLNDELFEKVGEKIYNYPLGWSYESNGYAAGIDFGGINIWSSEDEGRKFIEENNDYEDLKSHCMNKLSELYLLLGKYLNGEEN